MPGTPVTVTDQTFASLVLENEEPVLVEFYTHSSGPSLQMTPVLTSIAAEHPEIVVALLDMDRNPATTATYKIMSIPTMIVFRDGEAVRTVVGAMPKAELEHDLQEFLV